MAEKSRGNDIPLRPHVKTHQCLEIANLQTGYGAKGLTVSTIGETSVFVIHGFSDVTLAYPIIPDKFPSLVKLTQKAHVNVLVDSPTIITMLDACCIGADIHLNVLVKIDYGHHRCSVEPSKTEALTMAGQIASASHLAFGGILTHAGHAYTAKSKDEIRNIADTEQNVIIEFSEKLQSNGLTLETVSIGSTPTAMAAPKFKKEITEIRPGNYVFDNSQISLDSCHHTDCALSVLTNVVGVQDSHMVVDAGATTLSKDTGTTQTLSSWGYGVVLHPNETTSSADVKIVNLSHEYGKIAFTKPSPPRPFSPGDHLRIIPNHSCHPTNLYDQYNVVDDNRVIATWPIYRTRLSSKLV